MATSNRNKVREINEILQNIDINGSINVKYIFDEIKEDNFEVEEYGETYVENSVIKAWAYSKLIKKPEAFLSYFAERIPIGMPKTSTNDIEIIVREKVTGNLEIIISITSLSYLMDTPRSPLKIPVTQEKYLLMTG
ncbi:MAG: XTP/dITP diphosphohydrolase [Petrotoga sp.]|nr:XTP/dITP diphosphohydrolase [Petrotoga sp.]